MEIEKIRNKYEPNLKVYGFEFAGVEIYNQRYFYLQYKNKRNFGRFQNSVLNIWKDQQTGKIEGDLIFDENADVETHHFKHLSIKELFEILKDIEKMEIETEKWTRENEVLLNNLGFTSNNDFVQYHVYDRRYFYKDFKNENKNAVMRIWYDNKTGKFSADLSLNDKKYENLSMNKLFSILNGDLNEQ